MRANEGQGRGFGQQWLAGERSGRWAWAAMVGDGLEARAGGGRAGGAGDGRGRRRALGYPWARMVSGHRPAVTRQISK